MRLGLVVILAACSPGAPLSDPPFVPAPEACERPSLDEPARFVPCTLGGGIFGRWTIDDLGLPAYDYLLDQQRDARATFTNTEKLDRRDHWHAFGNQRVNAMLHNDGWVEVTAQDRGVVYLDKVDEERGARGGGWSYVRADGELWSTAYKLRPSSSRTHRRFGMGYAETSTEHAGVRVRHRFTAPPGDAPAVVDEVTVENTSGAARSLEHFEVWDVARRPIETNWVVSGSALPNAPANARAQRDARNASFTESVSWDGRALLLKREGSAPVSREAPSAIDHFATDVFLALLSGEASELYTEDSDLATFARGQGTSVGEKGVARSGEGQPRAFVVRTDLKLAPGESKELRFAYGFGRAIDPSWASRDLRLETARELQAHSMHLASDRDPVLHRELAWHASQIEVSVGHREYWNRRVVPQGSAYLYLHGADGALRDLGLFAAPLVYTHRELAREELLLAAGMQKADGRAFSYAFQGHGMLDDASGIHAAPSDLDLFFLWGVLEYVLATGDHDFLREPAPYWPKEALPNAIVLDHVRDAIRHFIDVVGTGPHGLARVGTGDWSDGIVFEAPDRDLAVAKGESVPNTQMAAWVLPLAADLVPDSLAQEARLYAERLRRALPSAWAGEFYGRAYFGDGELRYKDTVNLEAQVWALIADTFAKGEDRARALAKVAADLDDPSPTGATLVPRGQVWPAISALLTWGYAKVDPERSWKHFAKNTMAAHAVAFPHVWYGIWSGPDGLESAFGPRPGESWFSLVTPMVDFPVMNNNQHAMPLLAAIRALGVEPSPSGLTVRPPRRDFSLETELLSLRRAGDRVTGAYRPRGARRLEVTLGVPVLRAKVNDLSALISPKAQSVVLEFPPGGATFEIEGGT